LSVKFGRIKRGGFEERIFVFFFRVLSWSCGRRLWWVIKSMESRNAFLSSKQYQISSEGCIRGVWREEIKLTNSKSDYLEMEINCIFVKRNSQSGRRLFFHKKNLFCSFFIFWFKAASHSESKIKFDFFYLNNIAMSLIRKIYQIKLSIWNYFSKHVFWKKHKFILLIILLYYVECCMIKMK